MIPGTRAWSLIVVAALVTAFAGVLAWEATARDVAAEGRVAPAPQGALDVVETLESETDVPVLGPVDPVPVQAAPSGLESVGTLDADAEDAFEEEEKVERGGVKHTSKVVQLALFSAALALSAGAARASPAPPPTASSRPPRTHPCATQPRGWGRTPAPRRNPTST